MKFTAKYAASGNGGCPTVYLTDRGTAVVQGQGLTDQAQAALDDVLTGELAVEVPIDLLKNAVQKLM